MYKKSKIRNVEIFYSRGEIFIFVRQNAFKESQFHINFFEIL